MKTPTNSKAGRELDKDLPGHGSVPVHDIFSPQRPKANTPSGYASTGSLSNTKEGVVPRSRFSS